MKRKWLTAPYIIWMLLFTIVPLCIVIYFAFTDSVTGAFTFANIVSILDYASIFLRSIWLSVAATLLCLIIGYPVAYTIAQCKPRTQRILQMLIMLPMCLSFLLRTLAWVALLEDTGILNSLITSIGLKPLPLIRNSGAVILGMVYNGTDADNIFFLGSVGKPDVLTEEYVPFNVAINRHGEVHIEKANLNELEGVMQDEDNEGV